MTYVTLDTVKKLMEKHKRSVFYLYDDKNLTIWSQDDEDKSIEDSFNELQEVIEDCTGNYCLIELPEAAKGKGRKGGMQYNTKFTYRIKLNSKDAGINGSSNGGGNLSIILDLMRENRNLAVQNITDKNEAILKEINAKLEKKEKETDENPVRVFAEVFKDEFYEQRRAKKAFERASGAKAPEPTAAEINDEAKAPNGKKKQLLDALAKMKAVDPDYADNLDFLANYMTKNPNIYKEFISNLKNPTP